MKNKSFLALIGLISCSTPAFADCAQHIFTVKRVPGAQYIVKPLAFDNLLEVYVNGNLARQWKMPGSKPDEYDVGQLFTSGDNEVRFVGHNEQYGKNWHDPNPGEVGYSLPNVAEFKCQSGDYRGTTSPYKMFDHKYKIVN